MRTTESGFAAEDFNKRKEGERGNKCHQQKPGEWNSEKIVIIEKPEKSRFAMEYASFSSPGF